MGPMDFPVYILQLITLFAKKEIFKKIFGGNVFLETISTTVSKELFAPDAKTVSLKSLSACMKRARDLMLVFHIF